MQSLDSITLRSQWPAMKSDLDAVIRPRDNEIELDRLKCLSVRPKHLFWWVISKEAFKQQSRNREIIRFLCDFVSLYFHLVSTLLLRRWLQRKRRKYVERRRRRSRELTLLQDARSSEVHSQDKHTTSRLVRVFKMNKWILYDSFMWLKHTRGTGRRKDEISLLWALKEWRNEAEERKISSRTKKLLQRLYERIAEWRACVGANWNLKCVEILLRSY